MGPYFSESELQRLEALPGMTQLGDEIGAACREFYAWALEYERWASGDAAYDCSGMRVKHLSALKVRIMKAVGAQEKLSESLKALSWEAREALLSTD